MKIADFDALPISEYTGHPYDPEWGCQIQKPHKRRFRLFRMWKKPQPKQDHPRDFEVLADGPYAHDECGVLQEDGLDVAGTGPAQVV